MRVKTYTVLIITVGLVMFWLSSFQGLPFSMLPAPEPFIYDASGTSSEVVPVDVPTAGPVQVAYGSNGADVMKVEMYAGGEPVLVWACAAACDREEEMELRPGRYVFSIRCNGCGWYLIVDNRQEIQK